MGSCRSIEGVKDSLEIDRTGGSVGKPRIRHINFEMQGKKVFMRDIRPNLFVVREVGVANEETVRTPLDQVI